MTYTIVELQAEGDNGERLEWGADADGRWQCYHVEWSTWERKPEYDRDTAEELGALVAELVSVKP